jgi:hypothetical protein
MDLMEMNFLPNSFDVVIDKGCLDVVFCGENSLENAMKALKEVYKVIRNKGVFIMMTNTS